MRATTVEPSVFKGALISVSGCAVAAAILLLLVSQAFSSSAQRGRYQNTIEGAIVWNNYPKAEDRASWTGEKDSQGYATGSGTLNWFKGSKLVSKYSGTMVHGKWNGVVVNEDADGNKFRGNWVNGVRSSDWGQISGQGRYERTNDGLALVWNNYPKPEDQAMWQGSVAPNGTASGEGWLSWYKNGKLVGSYHGTMVNGKFNGFVINRDADGKKFQGTYADGIKTTDWRHVDRFTRPLTPEERALNDHWAQYLREIQNDNAWFNWTEAPYDLYRKNHAE
jgi:hypothetical protein